MTNLRVTYLMDVWVEDFLFDRQGLVQWNVDDVEDLVETASARIRFALRQMA